MPSRQVVPLRTRWADDVDPDRPLPEYPRPQLRRPRWVNLNGPWQLAITDRGAGAPAQFADTVIVPFPVGSALSGIDHQVSPDERVWLRRTFEAPALEPGERVRLHFGAVDWETEIWCDRAPVGTHRGGYDPFFLDLTDALATDEPHELVVAVWDPTDDGPQPVGKQTLRPSAIQYTPVTGIWQTVWLEPVPAACIESAVTTTDLARHEITVHVALSGSRDTDHVALHLPDGLGSRSAVADDHADLSLMVDDLHPWSPDDPHLYDIEVTLERDGTVVDRIESYFGAREVDAAPDADGIWRLRLNGEPVFHLGPLDQGWWPDGLYTAPTDEALAFDIEATRTMGYNTIRKHVKVEPARWYWHADRLGVLVWQDMPNTQFDLSQVIGQLADGVDPADMDYTSIAPARDRDGFRHELDAMLDALAPFPSIVVWVPFNEGWGQFDTDEVLAHVADRDPSRLVDGPSGWVDHGTGALRDHHVYRREGDLPALVPERPLVYGEFGGLGLQVDGHVTHRGGWGYAQAESADALATAYEQLIGVIAELVPAGLAGAIYTQTTDVESEHNGLLTYDRAVWKIEPERLAALHRPILER